MPTKRAPANTITKLIASFGTDLRSKLRLLSTGNDDSCPANRIINNVDQLEHCLADTRLFNQLSGYLTQIERDRQQILMENDLIKDELEYLRQKLGMSDLRMIDLEQDIENRTFDQQIRSIDGRLAKKWRTNFERDNSFNRLLSFEDDSFITAIDGYETDNERISLAMEYFQQYLQQGKFSAAISLCNKVITDLTSDTAAEHQPPQNRHHIAVMLEILALAHKEEYRYEEAADLMRQALDQYGDDDADRLRTLIELAELYELCGRASEAEELLRQVDQWRKVEATQTCETTTPSKKREQSKPMKRTKFLDDTIEEKTIDIECPVRSNDADKLETKYENSHRQLSAKYLREKNFDDAKQLYKNILSDANDERASGIEEQRPIWEIAEEIEKITQSNSGREMVVSDSYQFVSICNYRKWYDLVTVKHPGVTWALKKLAFTYRQQGQHSAAKILEHCLSIHDRKSFKGDSPANRRYSMSASAATTISVAVTPTASSTPSRAKVVRLVDEVNSNNNKALRNLHELYATTTSDMSLSKRIRM